jgi:hypothetical protein
VTFLQKENAMSTNSFFAKFLRFIGILLMGITALFTIAGGLGTTCVALNPTGFGESMAKLAPFQWLYITFVIVTVGIGVMMTRGTILLVKGQGKGYKTALVALVLGIVVGIIHILVSRALRGKSMPVDAVVYTTLLTLVILLLMRIPPIWNAVRFDRFKGSGDDLNRIAGASTLVVCGLLTLTVQYWAGPTHTWGGTNWAAAFLVTTVMLGLGQLLGGAALLVLREKAEVTARRSEVHA